MFLIAGLLVAVGLAVFVSGFASGAPDGLERVAEDKGFLDTARDHLLGGSPLADYGFEGVTDERLATALSGLVGVLVTFGVGLGLFALLRVVRGRRSGDGRSS